MSGRSAWRVQRAHVDYHRAHIAFMRQISRDESLRAFVLRDDWIDRLDPALTQGWSKIFSAFRTSDGRAGNADKSDSLSRSAITQLLDHVRRKMGELAEAWIAGDIAVRPAQLGKWTLCGECEFRRVCRMENPTRRANRLDEMSRTKVIERLAGDAGGSDG